MIGTLVLQAERSLLRCRMRVRTRLALRTFRQAHVRALCLVLAGLCSCTADAVVFRAALDTQDAGAQDAGSPPVRANDAGPAVFGCRSASNGGSAILSEILARLNEDFLTREKPPCSTDDDCSQTFVTPACDEATRACVPCPGVQQVTFGAALATCFVRAAGSCCRDPNAAMDCIVKACAIGCDGT